MLRATFVVALLLVVAWPSICSALLGPEQQPDLRHSAAVQRHGP